MKSTRAEVLFQQSSEADRFLPEGPRAITLDGRPALAWVNIQTAPDATHGDIHVRFWDGQHRTFQQQHRPGFLLPTDRPNCLLVGREKEIGLLDLTINHFTPLAAIDDASPRTIINDGEVVPGGGAVVFGTKDVKFADPIANLYLFTLDDRKISVLADRQTCSNGKVFTRDDRGLALYDIDTPKRNVVRYRLDLQACRLDEQQLILDVSDQDGFPDGMCDAGDGSVIIAFYNPAAVADGRAVRFDLASGLALEEWVTPGSPRVTCPLLIPDDWGMYTLLVLTTATEGMADEQRRTCPAAGDLFSVETNLTKVPRKSEQVRLEN
jgi:sugar lactone lactonase YvrE